MHRLYAFLFACHCGTRLQYSENGRQNGYDTSNTQARRKTLTALLSGEIDHHWAAILREKIDERAAAAAPAILILDFSAVTFMDSSGIGLILGRHKLISAMGGVVVVQKAPKDIKRMLSIAGIESKD